MMDDEPDNDTPLYPADIFLDKEIKVPTLSINVDFLGLLEKEDEENTFRILHKLKDMFG